MWWTQPQPKRASISNIVFHAARAAVWIVIATVAWISLLPGAAIMPIGRGLAEHFFAYAVLGAMAGIGYGGNAARYRWLTFILTVCAGIFELAQIWTPGRTPSIPDLVSSGIGALVGIVCAYIVRLLLGLDRGAAPEAEVSRASPSTVSKQISERAARSA